MEEMRRRLERLENAMNMPWPGDGGTSSASAMPHSAASMASFPGNPSHSPITPTPGPPSARPYGSPIRSPQHAFAFPPPPQQHPQHFDPSLAGASFPGSASSSFPAPGSGTLRSPVLERASQQSDPRSPRGARRGYPPPSPATHHPQHGHSGSMGSISQGPYSAGPGGPGTQYPLYPAQFNTPPGTASSSASMLPPNTGSTYGAPYPQGGTDGQSFPSPTPVSAYPTSPAFEQYPQNPTTAQGGAYPPQSPYTASAPYSFASDPTGGAYGQQAAPHQPSASQLGGQGQPGAGAGGLGSYHPKNFHAQVLPGEHLRGGRTPGGSRLRRQTRNSSSNITSRCSSSSSKVAPVGWGRHQRSRRRRERTSRWVRQEAGTAHRRRRRPIRRVVSGGGDNRSKIAVEDIAQPRVASSTRPMIRPQEQQEGQSSNMWGQIVSWGFYSEGD